MGWFSKATSLVFGGGKVTNDIFDKDNGHLAKAGKWIDNWAYTDQERAEDRKEIAKGVRDFAIATMQENTERSKARRDLAIFIIKFFSLLIFWSGLVYPFNSEWSEYLFRLATETNVGVLTAGVGLFFWGSHTLQKYQQGKNQ